MNKFVPYEDRAASLTLRLAYLWLCALQLRDPHDPATQRDLDLRKVNVYWWHRLLGFTHAGATLNPFPPPLALLVALLWATERRVRGFASRLAPPAAGGDKERILHIPANTGMGDLLCQPSLMLYAARMLGFKKLAVDWRRSSYLTDRDVDLFAELFDVVSTPDVEVVPIGQVDAARHVLVPVKVSAVSPTPVSCWDDRGWRVLSPQIVYFGDFLDRFPLTPNDTWWDAPLAETPPPFQWFRGLPINRGVWRRIFRDERAFVDAIRLKPQFLQPFEAFVQRELRCSGASATIGVHVRHGNGETGEFTALGRGLIAPSLEAAVERVHARIEPFCPANRPHTILVMSDSQSFIEAYRQLKAGGLRRVVTREQWKPPDGAGAFFVAGSATAGFNAEQACTPPDELQLAADAVIDMLCLAACDVFLATSHSMFTFYPAKLGQPMGRVSRQLNRGVRDHERDYSSIALCEYN